MRDVVVILQAVTACGGQAAKGAQIVNTAGSGRATQMYVAEIEVYPSCQSAFHAS